MAAHSSILAWRIPWTEEPGGLQSMGSKKKKKRYSLTYQCPSSLQNLKHYPNTDKVYSLLRAGDKEI